MNRKVLQKNSECQLFRLFLAQHLLSRFVGTVGEFSGTPVIGQTQRPILDTKTSGIAKTDQKARVSK